MCGGVAGLREFRRAFAALIFSLFAAAAPVRASDLFTPPDGCEVYLTVQAKGCKVSHHYICRADPAGDQWRVDFDLKGPYFVSRINAETEWLQSIDLTSGEEIRLMPGPADPASFTELTTTGTDSYDFAQSAGRSGTLRYSGFDHLTGRKTVIDGVELEETAFEFREETLSGQLIGTARGHEYIHRGWRLFFSGPSTWEGDEGRERIDRSPVRFDEPGDAGFRSVTPEYDCTAQLAALP
ncbi:hypothetical protein EG244_01190 [Falsigemmobacter faecalis]|uniref:DUF4178 domain-containing protein n=1 Tax=Falsigemmobacter faecalis TaxID=2488730 RepID=A0A3P3DWH9_9RHOB|nr:hypothetical protein EG244_01190 [Falsigemmobacter faecalis]